MKKVLALVVVLIMLMGISAPAEEMAGDLERVTLAVKNTLGISDDFDDFSGDKSGNKWYLNWNGDECDISVTAGDDGKIYSYYVYDYNDSWDRYDSGFKPAFPDSAPESIVSAAKEFAERVLGEGESWKFLRSTGSGLNTGAGESNLQGRIEINGMPSDVTADITIDTATLKATGFYRSDCYMEFASSEISGVINADGEEARRLLLDNMPLELRYYITRYGEPAQLVYLPDFDGRYIVRAEDGQLVNIEALYAEAYAEEAAMAMDAGGFGEVITELSEAEKAGVGAYEDVLSVDELEKMLRATAELGITEDYIIHAADYYSMDYYISAELSFARELSDEEIAQRHGLSQERIEEMRAQGSKWYDTKNARVNAHNGSIEYFDTWRSGNAYAAETDPSAWQDMVDGFISEHIDISKDEIELEKAWSENGYRAQNSAYYLYNRVYNGYPFPENYLSISVNPADGTIDSIMLYWDNQQEFIDAQPAISAQEAAEIYFNSMEYECAYVSVPTNEYSDYDMVYDRMLAWQFSDLSNVYGVDAVTGEALSYGDDIMSALEYSDIEDVAQKEMIERLAMYGVGFAGGEFMPEKKFTISDMLTFIISMDGETGADFMTHEDKSVRAMHLGAGDFSGDDPEREISKGEFIKALVSMAGYGDAAALTGIYSCRFTDEGDISENDMGSAAIAYALGFLKQDSEGRVNFNSEITRAEAAEIAHDFLAAEK